METELSNAIKLLINALQTDEGYRIAWVANIAMAYKDNERWYKEKTGKKRLTYKDKHKIANISAEYFINQLCK